MPNIQIPFLNIIGGERSIRVYGELYCCTHTIQESKLKDLRDVCVPRDRLKEIKHGICGRHTTMRTTTESHDIHILWRYSITPHQTSLLQNTGAHDTYDRLR